MHTSPPLLPGSYLHTSPKYPPNIVTSLPSICRALQFSWKIRCLLNWAARGPYKRLCTPARLLTMGRLLVTDMSRNFCPRLYMPKISMLWRAVGMLLSDSGMITWLLHKLIASVSLAGLLTTARTGK